MASALRKRGMAAESCAQHGLDEAEDPDMIEGMAAKLKGQRWVLVTDDDRMPLDHAWHITMHQVTVATLDGRNRPEGPPLEDWKWEVVHRWAHVMAAQQPCSVRRYRPTSHRLWTPRVR